MVSRWLLELVSLLPLLLGVLWGWYHCRHRRLLSLARRLPTVVPTVPVLGHLYLLPKFYKNINDYPLYILKLARKAIAKDNGNFCHWVGPSPYLVVQYTEDIQTILNSSKSINKGPELDHVADFGFKDSIIAAKVDIWKPSRRLFLPIFHPQNFGPHLDDINKIARSLVQELREFIGKDKPVDVLPKVLPLQARSVHDLLFGKYILHKNMNQWISTLLEIFALFTNLWLNRMMKFWFLFDASFIFNVVYKKDVSKLDNSRTKLLKPAFEVLRSRKVDGLHQGGPVEAEGEICPLNLIDVYLSVAKGDLNLFDPENFKMNAGAMYAAGIETSAITISSCLLMLAVYPEIQEKVYKEVISKIGNSDEDMTYEEVNSLTYLDKVVKETTRMFPPVPFISRKVTQDLKLSFGTVPANTSLTVCIYGLHMDPKIFPEPDRFDPERFSEEASRKRHKYSHIPFSAGPRNCIAKGYAMTSMKTMLAHVIKNFKLQTKVNMSEIEFTYSVELIKKNGYPIYVQKRI